MSVAHPTLRSYSTRHEILPRSICLLPAYLVPPSLIGFGADVAAFAPSNFWGVSRHGTASYPDSLLHGRREERPRWWQTTPTSRGLASWQFCETASDWFLLRMLLSSSDALIGIASEARVQALRRYRSWAGSPKPTLELALRSRHVFQKSSQRFGRGMP